MKHIYRISQIPHILSLIVFISFLLPNSSLAFQTSESEVVLFVSCVEDIGNGELLAWFGYVRWYSVLGHRGSKALIPGTELPEFELQTLRGEPINSSSFRGRNHVLVFYRGNWCPLCSAQISELAAQYRKLQAADTEVVLISSQPQNHSLHLAKKFDAPMIFLRDKNNAAAGILGIKHRFGTPMGMQILGYDNDTALPTVIITNKQGTILHVDETDNYRLRPDPALFLDILMKHEAV